MFFGVGLGLITAIWFVGRFAQLLATFFCGLLIAVLLTTVASAAARWLRWPYWAGFASALGCLSAATAVAVWLLGGPLLDQASEMTEAIPQGLATAKEWLSGREWGKRIVEALGEPRDLAPSPRVIAKDAGALIAAASGVLTSLLVAWIVGIFLAAKPAVYQRGLLRLFPQAQRHQMTELLDEVGHGLRSWLLARLLLMALIGVLMGVGLALIGVRLALPLAVLAALLSFVPYVGPLAAFVPALLVALLHGPSQALHVTGLYLGVQLVESYVAEPIIESRAVTIPPVLLLFGQGVLAFSLGGLGVLIATPLVVVVVTVVRKLWVEGALGDTSAPKG